MISRNAKIAGIAALAGIMFVVAVETFREPGDMPLDAVLPLLDEGEARTLLARELERCAALTMPDKDCETAWAENRRRFFGRDSAVPAPAEAGPVSAADNSAASDDSRANEAIRPDLPGNYVPADRAGTAAP
ncbi:MULTISPECIES: putative entry exclusion protein TrbK-alt [Sphingobium]|uniref:putative entry exclusion protein TrbK-alt n=1 Tax=Sphingobium TaxID=165695 RepID=UPI00087746E6|nr:MULTISPECIES: putative entry exclusion protein TrbK-alt [Sphingobium]WDA38414.1 putative entry exclusion protein TrbK-alt [Sphingobium sp. YC-XJ3]SCW79419.1 conjugative transfer region protein TrbK [Sphingobium faniae]